PRGDAIHRRAGQGARADRPPFLWIRGEDYGGRRVAGSAELRALPRADALGDRADDACGRRDGRAGGDVLAQARDARRSRLGRLSELRAAVAGPSPSSCAKPLPLPAVVALPTRSDTRGAFRTVRSGALPCLGEVGSRGHGGLRLAR